jgi:hypothetical protein
MFAYDSVSFSIDERPRPVPNKAKEESVDVWSGEFEGKSDAEEIPPV